MFLFKLYSKAFVISPSAFNQDNYLQLTYISREI